MGVVGKLVLSLLSPGRHTNRSALCLRLLKESDLDPNEGRGAERLRFSIVMKCVIQWHSPTP